MDGYTEVFAWGNDTAGQLGLAHKDKTKAYSLPRFCCFNVLIKAVSCGETHSAFIEASGLVYTIGSNSDGRLGVGKKGVGHSRSPCLVEALSHIRAVGIACGGAHTLAVGEEGQVYSWGAGETGSLGSGDAETHWAPVEVVLPRGFHAVAVSCGYRHSAVLGDLPDRAGLLLTCGAGEDGQLGTGRRDKELTPVLLSHPEPVKQVVCGTAHTVFVTVFGKAFAMGGNAYGQLGNGTRRNSANPVPVSGMDGISVMKVAAGSHTAALGNDGRLYIWGFSPLGEALSPFQVPLSRGLLDLSIGAGFGAAIDSAFQIWTWGGNTSGELGLGDFKPRPTPSAVSALHSKKVKSLSCGGGFVLALGCDVKKGNRNPTPCRLVRVDGVETYCSAKTTSRPQTPYEPSSVYESMPTSTREMRIKSATPEPSSHGQKPTSDSYCDVDGFVRKLEARLQLESQVGQLLKSNQSLEQKLSETTRLLDEERTRRKQLESELEKSFFSRGQDLQGLSEKLRLKETALLELQATHEKMKGNLSDFNLAQTTELKEYKEECEDRRRKLEIEVEKREGEVLSLQALVEKLQMELTGKTQEVREMSQEMEARASEMIEQKTLEKQDKDSLQTALRTLTSQLKDSQTSLQAAKSDIENLRTDLQTASQTRSKDSTSLRDREAEIRSLRKELEQMKNDENSGRKTDAENQRAKMTAMEMEIEKMRGSLEMGRNKNGDLDGKLKEKEREIAVLSGRNSDYEQEIRRLRDQVANGDHYKSLLEDLQDQHTRTSRDYRLLKETLEKAEDHNKQLLEALDKRTLSKAREYREKSLSVLNTPSPLRSRSPISLLRRKDPESTDFAIAKIDQNEKKEIKGLSLQLVSPRLVLKEQDLNRQITPPTFRENGGFGGAEGEREDVEICRKKLFSLQQ